MNTKHTRCHARHFNQKYVYIFALGMTVINSNSNSNVVDGATVATVGVETVSRTDNWTVEIVSGLRLTASVSAQFYALNICKARSLSLPLSALFGDCSSPVAPLLSLSLFSVRSLRLIFRCYICAPVCAGLQFLGNIFFYTCFSSTGVLIVVVVIVLYSQAWRSYFRSLIAISPLSLAANAAPALSSTYIHTYIY